METFIALLRGINVGGHKKIKMADLRSYLASLNFEEVRTYIQSGNIVFNASESDTQALAASIKDLIQHHYGFEVPTVVKRPADFEKAIRLNPYPDAAKAEPKHVFLAFLYAIPETERVKKITAMDLAPERFELIDDLLFFHSPGGFSKGKMSTNFFEQKLKVNATTRNWRSVEILYGMANEIA